MYIKNEDTICAPATIPGTGAISVIRVSGPEALDIADKVIRCRKGTIGDAAGYTIRFGTVTDASGAVIDEVLTSVFRAPHSYTGRTQSRYHAMLLRTSFQRSWTCCLKQVHVLPSQENSPKELI